MTEPTLNQSIAGRKWESLPDAKVLLEQLERLRQKDKRLYRKTFSLILESGWCSFAKFIEEEGRAGMELAQNAAKWINDSEPKNFRNEEVLLQNFWIYGEETAQAWSKHQQLFQNEEEYLEIARTIIEDSKSARVMWNATNCSRKGPRLGYLCKKLERKPVLVVINQDGFIEYARTLKPNWEDILGSAPQFYEIDPVPELF